MRIVITSEHAVLEDPAVFTALSARHDDGVDVEAVTPAIERDGDHVWIERDWFPGAAGAAADHEWHRGFAAMWEFARTMGWVDDRERVRAHLD